jgi:UDP-N-acetylglucosamine acyltransferase
MSAPAQRIHPTAVIDTRAELAEDVEVGPYAVIGAGVRIGRGCKIKTHAVVEGRTTLGEGNTVFQFASVGSQPQDLKYKGEPSELIIGDHNTIREFASLNPGTSGGGMLTRVGNNNLLMMYCHIAHDCIMGNRNVIANGATLGGHVVLEDFCIIGGLAGIHQFVHIGTGAILGAGSMVSKDVPPYCNATGDRATLHGLNVEGLRRRGFTAEQIDALRKTYRIMFQSRLLAKQALERVRSEVPQTLEVQKFVSFIEQSKRGICR